MRSKSVFCLVGILIILLSGFPTTAFAQKGKGCTVEIDAEVAGDDTIKVHLVVRNMDSDDLGTIYVTGFVPDGAKFEQSWGGTEIGKNQGNF